jgi:acetyltransferase-like isoleucine patch superfamily enzyme
MGGGFQQLKKKLKRLRSWLVRIMSRTRIKGAGGNHLVLNDARLYRCQITFDGSGNVLEIGAGAILHQARINIIGNGNRLKIGEMVRIRGGATLVVEDSESQVLIGNATTMTNPTIVCSEGGRITIGEDCMIAMGTCIRNSDGHAIIDSTSGLRINKAADITIADHVWLGIRSLILKGSLIGTGAIVGAKSVVTGSIEPGCVAIGSPARTVRKNVLWTRERNTETRPPFDPAALGAESETSQSR